MPFGRMFGAVFLGGPGSLLAVRLLGRPETAARIAGAFALLLALTLAVALLRGRRWARWAGLVAACVIAGAALSVLADGANAALYLMLLGGMATALLLAYPPTAGIAEGAARSGRGLESVAVVALVGLVTAGVWAGVADGPADGDTDAVLPATSIQRPLRFAGFAEGQETARREGRPMLVTFVTDWCPYCRKMGQIAWNDRRVQQLAAELVPVRIDAEKTTAGRQLASRYGVAGFPTQLLLDPEGRVLSRADGYQTAADVVRWLERALGPGPSGTPASRRSLP